MRATRNQHIVDMDPRHIEFLPVVPCNEATKKKDKNFSSHESFDEKGLFSSFLSDVGSLALKGGIAYRTGGFSLLRYTKTFANIAIDIKNGNFDSAWKKTFKNLSFTPKIKNIQKLIVESNDESALIQLDEVLLELETIDDFEMRAALNVLRGKLHYKNGRFLIAAIYYMEAATLTSSQKLQKMGEGEKEGQINKSAMLYLISLQSLSAYLKTNKIDENFQYLINDLAKRATTLFDKEAGYRSTDCWHLKKSGEVSLGKVKIPYGWFQKDEKSADLNKKLSLEIEKIKCLIEKRDLIKDVGTYLVKESYKDEEVDFLLEAAEQISKDRTIELKDSVPFFDFLEKKMNASSEYNNCLSHLEILKTQMKLQIGKGTESDILMIFKLLDKEKADEASFHHLLAIADKLSTQLTIEQRKEFANVMVEKDYPFLSTIHKSCYKKIDDNQFISENSELNCIYPSNVAQLRSELEKLEVKDRAIIYKGNIEVLDHKMFKEAVVKKAKFIFPDEDMREFGFILNSTEKKDIENKTPFEIDNLLGLATELINDLHLSEKLPGIKDRIKNQKARIGVFGLTKVGKSTFLNTMIGKEILKSDRGVATNIVTIIKKSPLNKVKVCFIDERIVEVPLEEVSQYTSEQGNPQNIKNVSKVEVMLDCALPGGLEVLDIPGFGVNEENHHLHQEVIDKCLSMVDGVFLVTTPNDGLKSYEIEFIKKAFIEKKLPFVLIANKMDELDDNEVLDLKPGLQEKLEKNGLSNGMFPIYFVSSQLGLAFIEGIEKNRYLGRSIDEAQLESGLLLVKESVRSISEKILSLKESSIIGALSVEVEKYKQSQIQIILDTEIVQKNSTSENVMALNSLKDEISELKSLLTSELNIFGSNLKSLHDLDIDGMVNRLSGKVEFGLFSGKREDNQNAKDQCEKIFKDEIGCILQFMDESIETCNANLKEFIESRKGTPFTFDEVQFSDSAENYNQAEVGTMDNVGHIITKLLAQSDTVRNECMKILSYIKIREVSFRVNQLKGVKAQEASFESSLNVRLNNIEEAMNYKEGEFKEKVTYCTEQVEKSNHYLRKLQI